MLFALTYNVINAWIKTHYCNEKNKQCALFRILRVLFLYGCPPEFTEALHYAMCSNNDNLQKAIMVIKEHFSECKHIDKEDFVLYETYVDSKELLSACRRFFALIAPF